MDLVGSFIEKNKLFRAGDAVLVGFSGGADSLMLLDYLWENRERLKISVAAVHVHHGIRKKSADEDEAFTADFCRGREIPYAAYHVDARSYAKNHGLSLEEAARVLRFRALEDAAQSTRASKIALAHHQNDQAETILFQMLRGSGLKGLSGMEAKRNANRELGFTSKQVMVVRPILCLEKAQILEYLQERGLSWREDETNAKDDASRNRIRHHVLPELTVIRPDAVKKIAGTGEYLAEVDQMLRDEANSWVSEHEIFRNGGDPMDGAKEERHEMGTLEIPAEAFASLPKIRQEYVVTSSLRFLQYPMKDVGRKHIDAAVDLAAKSVGKIVFLPNGGCVKRTYEGLKFMRRAVDRKQETDKVAGTIRVTSFAKPLDQTFPKNEYTKWFDCDKIEESPVLRTRQEGDRISLSPGTHKKLSDYYIDGKIPREERAGIPVVASGQEILWVIGYRMSEEFKVTEQTETVCQIEYFAEGEEENG